jgi:hypothetical protein
LDKAHQPASSNKDPGVMLSCSHGQVGLASVDTDDNITGDEPQAAIEAILSIDQGKPTKTAMTWLDTTALPLGATLNEKVSNKLKLGELIWLVYIYNIRYQTGKHCTKHTCEYMHNCYKCKCNGHPANKCTVKDREDQKTFPQQ